MRLSEVKMRSLILHPTSIAQWHALILEAQKTLSIQLQEELEAYLVFLLMRFTGQPDVAHSVLGLDFLESTQQMPNQQPDLLKNVGDKCLLFAGLFPDRALRRRVNQAYFIHLGKTAYMNLASSIILASQAELFLKLCQEFLLLTDILQATREIAQPDYDLMKQIDRWNETGSSFSWHKIQQATESLPTQPSNAKKNKKSLH